MLEAFDFFLGRVEDVVVLVAVVDVCGLGLADGVVPVGGVGQDYRVEELGPCPVLANLGGELYLGG